MNCGPRSCADAGAFITNPTNVTNAAAALIVMKVLLAFGVLQLRPSLAGFPDRVRCPMIGREAFQRLVKQTVVGWAKARCTVLPSRRSPMRAVPTRTALTAWARRVVIRAKPEAPRPPLPTLRPKPRR